MAYDDDLADRVRAILEDVPHVTERKMFGGLTFLVSGNMACGIVGQDLMVRLGDAAADAALDEPHVRPMDFTGRPMRSMVYVGAAGVRTDPALDRWVRLALDHVDTLPAKRSNP